jgi:peptidoglycan/xylan/chitin deacetylase (PgdA/CDA1 family)
VNPQNAALKEPLGQAVPIDSSLANHGTFRARENADMTFRNFVTRHKGQIFFIAIALFSGSTSYALGRSGADPGQSITRARCRVGAFIKHSDQVGAVEADSAGTQSSNSVGTYTGVKYTAPVQDNATTGPNLIPGPAYESNGYSATGWATEIYGSSRTKFAIVPGRSGDLASKVTITSYKGGDADWYSPRITVVPGKFYTFSDYYQSNVSTRPVLELYTSSGLQLINLENASPESHWTKYTTSFLVPYGVTQITVFHPIESAGWLTTDTESLEQLVSAGFKEPLVSLTFDDGWESIHTNALPLLEKYGMVSTQYIISGYLGQSSGYMSVQDVYDFLAEGSEIGSHTVDHLDLTSLPIAKAQYELSQSKHDLGVCFATPTDYAMPYGTYTQTTTSLTSSLYQTARSTDTGYNFPADFEPYQLKVQNVQQNTTEAQIKTWLTTAKLNNLWLILVYHQVAAGAGEYSRTPADLNLDLAAVQDSRIKVVTVHNAYAEIKPQL